MKKTKITISISAWMLQDYLDLMDEFPAELEEYIDLDVQLRFGEEKPTNKEYRQTKELLDGIFWLFNDIKNNGIYSNKE